MGDNPVGEEVRQFDKTSLKKANTKEKCFQPTKEDLEQDRKEQKEGKK